MPNPDRVQFGHDRFDVPSISDALDEALTECERHPQTDLWLSFWDRLTAGAYAPERPAAEEG